MIKQDKKVWLDEIEHAINRAWEQTNYYDIEVLQNVAEHLYELRLNGKKYDEENGAHFVANFLRKSKAQMLQVVKSTRKMLSR